MSIDIHWYNEEKTLLQLILSGAWDWPDFELAFYRGLEMTTGLDHTAHCMIEFVGQSRRPQGNGLMHLKRMTKQISAYPNAGMCYLVNPNPFARSLIGLLLRVYGEDEHLIMTGSRDDAFRRMQSGQASAR